MQNAQININVKENSIICFFSKKGAPFQRSHPSITRRNLDHKTNNWIEMDYRHLPLQAPIQHRAHSAGIRKSEYRPFKIFNSSHH